MSRLDRLFARAPIVSAYLSPDASVLLTKHWLGNAVKVCAAISFLLISALPAIADNPNTLRPGYIYYNATGIFAPYAPIIDAYVGRDWNPANSTEIEIDVPYTVAFADGTFLGSNFDYVGLYVHNKATVEQTGGFIKGVSVHDNALFIQRGGGLEGVTTNDNAYAYVYQVGVGTYGNSTIDAESAGGSTHDNSTLNIRGGTVFVDGGVHSYGSSTVNIQSNGGGRMTAHENSKVNISGGRTFSTSASGSSQIKMTGGSSDYVTLSESSSLILNAGSIGNFSATGNTVTTLNGGSIQSGNFSLSDNAVLNVNAGTISTSSFYGALSLSGSSQLNVTGGDVLLVNASGNSSVVISGGTILTTTYSGIPTSFLATTSAGASYTFVATDLRFALREGGSYGGATAFTGTLRGIG